MVMETDQIKRFSSVLDEHPNADQQEGKRQLREENLD